MVAACIATMFAFAINEPTLPTEYVTTLTNGNKYQVKNADSDQFIGAGRGYNLWTTAATMVDRGDAITYIIDETVDTYGEGYTFVDYDTGRCTYISNDGTNEDRPTWGEMHVDMSTQGYNHFQIENNGDGTFRIKTPEYPGVTEEGEEVVYSGYWGWVKMDVDYAQAVWGMLDPSVDGNYCNWQFIDVTYYTAKLELYEVITKYETLTGIDASVIAAATVVYEDDNATYAEMSDAMDMVLAARNEVICGSATSSNPVDATELLDNPDFEKLNISGWDCTFVSGENATYAQYQSTSYKNTSYTYVNHLGEEVNPSCSHFIEAWADAGMAYGSTEVSRSVGDGELSQTIKNLPAGNWRLSVDVIAVQQSDQSANPVKGTELFASSGSYDTPVELATGDGIPEHIEMLFASDGSTVTLGLRTNNTTANWIAADNFELLYYGNETDNPYYFALQIQVNESESAIGTDMGEVFADAAIKATYEEAFAVARNLLDNANGTDEEYIAATDALAAATESLETSMEKYASVASLIDYINSISDKAEAYNWTELVDELADMRDELQAGYYDGTLTDDEIDSVEDDVHNAIADYIGYHVEAGQDITLVISNPDFDTDFSGWTVTGTTPTFGGNGIDFGGADNTVDGGVQPTDIGSGDAEVYHAVFDMSQTIPTMPIGLYTLSCSGFARDDGGDGIQGVLYASVNGQEQTQTLTDIYADGSAEILYVSSDGSFSDASATLSDGSAGYVPYGMAGANVYFYLGHYHNEFNFLVQERGDLTIGVRETADNDWVIFDNFQLVYQGSDNSAYVDVILQLLSEADAVYDKGLMSDEAYQQLEDAMDEGYAALEDNNANVSVAAINSLQAAIEAAEESIALVSDLEYLANYTNDVRLGELTSSISGEITDMVGEVLDALNTGFETDAQIESYSQGLKATYNKCVMYDHLDATEDAPADVSGVIINPIYTDVEGYTSNYGWDINDGTNLGLNYYTAEIYNQDAGAGLSQVIYNLYAGWYRLGVQGFYRPGTSFLTYGDNNTSTIDASLAEEENDTIHHADLFAGSAAARVVSIFSDAEGYNAALGGSSAGKYYVPNSMEQANASFDFDLYHNTLQFQVAEDGTDVPVGIVKTGHVDYDWLIFSNWTLQYLGTTEPAEDPTTAIESVDGSGSIVATAIYSVNGTMLKHPAKGINIVKTTLSDGTTRVSKVLVK